MLFFGKKHGFATRRNIILRMFDRLVEWLPMIAVFLLGIFGNHVYHKNNPAQTPEQQSNQLTTEVEKLTRALSEEKDITDRLSLKNVTLLEQLDQVTSIKEDSSGSKEASSNNKTYEKLEAVLKKENETLQKKLDAQLALSKSKSEETLETQKENNEKINSLTSDLASSKQSITSLTKENANLKAKLEKSLVELESEKTNTTLAKNTSSKSRNIETVATDNSDIKDEPLQKVALTTPSLQKEQNNEIQALTTTSAKQQSDTEVKAIRTMKLKKGESLWNLSKRAYGKGIHYKRILKENPSISEKSFRKLRPGTEIRVPE